MVSPELDRLIVEHLSDLDESAKRLTLIEREVFGAMDSIAAEWAKKQGWVGGLNFYDDQLWLAPPEWRKPDTKDSGELFNAWFQMQFGAGDTANYGTPEEDYFRLTRLCRAGIGTIGFGFKQDLVTRGAWKKKFQSLADLSGKTAFVAASEPSFFLPFQPEDSKLANSLQDESIETALSPFKEALEKLAEARSVFDDMISALKASTAK